MTIKIIEKNPEDIHKTVSGFKIEGKNILVKPNLVSFEPYPTTTDPMILDSVLNTLKGYEVIVANGPGTDLISLITKGELSKEKLATTHQRVDELKLKEKYRWDERFEGYISQGGLPEGEKRSYLEYFKRIVNGSELLKVCRKYDVNLTCFSLSKEFDYKEVEFQDVGFRLVDLKNFDALINLPVLKTHSHTGITGAIKNLYGLIQPFDKLMLHAKTERGNLNFMQLLDALPSMIDTPIYTFLDATIVPNYHERVWEEAEKVVEYKVDGIIYGDDPKEVDEEARRILRERGLFPKDFVYKNMTK